MATFDQQAFLTHYAPPPSGQTYGGGDNITAIGRGPDVPAYPGGYVASSDSPAQNASMDGVPGARAQQVLIWFGGEITATGLTVVIEEQLVTYPWVAGTTPSASGVYRPLAIVNFGGSPASSGTWNVSGAWTASPISSGSVAGQTVGGVSGTGTGSSGSNGPTYTHLIIEVSPNAYSVNYNVIQYAGGGHADCMNVVVIPFEGSSKPVGSPV